MEFKASFQEFRRKNRPVRGEGEVGIKTEDWVDYIKGTLGVLRARPINSSIHRVPSNLRRLNPDAYSPRVVSIGPYHNGDPNLLDMEELKWHFMLRLFHQPPQQSQERRQSIKDLAIQRADDCPRALLGLASEIRGSYTSNIDISDHDLAEMMLVDGCFVLELLVKYSARPAAGTSPNSELKFHPIFNSAWMIPNLRHDLLLLENQIPFFVLEKLLEVIKPDIPASLPQSLTELALSFFFDPLSLKPPPPPMGGEIRHLLDLLHKVYLPSPVRSCEKPIWGFKYSAMGLVERGIRIRKEHNSDGLLDITFSKSEGDLRIPNLRIDQDTESVFRNLIALEQCGLSSTDHVTSYALLLRSLIRSQRDVRYLQQKGVITLDDPSAGGGAGDPEKLFRGLCEGLVKRHSYFAALCDDANEYDRMVAAEEIQDAAGGAE